MSQAVRVGVWILAVLVLISAGVAVFTLIQKQKLEQQNQSLESKLSEYQSKEMQLLEKAKKLEADQQQLNDRISQKDREKNQVQSAYDELKRKSDEIQSQVDQITSERDDWKNRVDNIKNERDELMEKLKNRPKEIVYKDRPVEEKPVAEAVPVAETVAPQGDQYWADIIKQKASLQLELEKAKSDLDKSVLQIVELKKQNTDLQFEIKNVVKEKEEIEHRIQNQQEDFDRKMKFDAEEATRKVKYGEDLANNLSMDLARSRNDQKFVNERAEKVKEENLNLQEQIKQLSTTKLALDKTVSRLTDEKDQMQKKLVETENMIQGRIEEIWKIKDTLDRKIAEAAPKPLSGSVELSPIIVNPTKNQQEQASSGKNQGAIISINTANNFVISDLGQDNSSVSVGNVIKVFRGNKEIGTLEVIQVRKDISAADIKYQATALKVGDSVKLSN